MTTAKTTPNFGGKTDLISIIQAILANSANQLDQSILNNPPSVPHDEYIGQLWARRYLAKAVSDVNSAIIEFNKRIYDYEEDKNEY